MALVPAPFGRHPRPASGFDAVRSVCYSEVVDDRRPARILVPVNLTSCGMVCRLFGRAQGFAMLFFPAASVRVNKVYPQRVNSFTCSRRFFTSDSEFEPSVIGRRSGY